jgi:hypothetical protein
MKTNYKYLKDNNLFEAHLRFKRAIGEAFSFAPIEEAEDDQNQQQDPMGGAPGEDPMGGGAPGGDPMGGGAPGGDPMGGGGAPGGDPMDGGGPGGAPGGDPIGGDSMGGGATDGAPGEDPMGGGAPGGDPMGGDPMGGMEEGGEQEEDDVIDVDDLTDAQEKVNDKVNSVGRDLGNVDKKIGKLIGAIETLQNMFNQNNEKIEDLKREIEKRNPTQTEKLNLRSIDSYPFVDKPTDYWAKKTANSNYSVYADNDEPTTQEYVITNNDVDDFTERDIEDSFSISDELDQNIKKIFGL